MAPRFEDLLAAGGVEEDAGPSFADLVKQGGQVEEGPSEVGSFVQNLVQGGTARLGDEMEGAQQGTVAALLGAGDAALRGDWEGVKSAPKLGLETYRAVRDGRREVIRRDQEVNPTASTAGEIVGAVGTGLATGGLGAGLRGAVATGAAEGAASGFGGNEDDLTYRDTEAYARAFRDSLAGGATGAAFGAGGYGAGRLVQAVGSRARDALGRARGQLADEARAGLDAEADALRAADAKAEARMGDVQGRAMEANKQVDARAAREEARRVAREAREAARAARQGAPRAARAPVDPNADPDTDVLVGYARGARKLRKDNAREVRDARKLLSDEKITPSERAEQEAYVRLHGDAVDNPVAFRLRSIEENLRKKGYSPEVVRRAMARLDAQGNAVSRRAAPAPALPETTQLQNADDYARRGDFARAGGGGSAWRDYSADARTVVDDLPPPGTPSFSQEEVVARHRNAQGAPAEAWRSWREWETAPQTVVDGAPPIGPGLRRLYRVEGVEPGGMTEPVRGHEWFTDRLGVADEGLRFRTGDDRMRYIDVPEEEARKMLALNRPAPRFARASGDKGREWAVPDKLARKAEEFPVLRESTEGLEDLDDIASEAQGVPHWARGVDGPFLADEELVETVAGPRPVAPTSADEVTGAMQPIDAVRQGRGQDLVRMGGGGSAWPPEEVTEAAVQRVAPLSARPALREGQPYAPYAAPRRASLPPEDVAAADEAMAARRAAAFGSGPSGPMPAAPPASEATRATAVPEVRRPAPAPRQQASPEGAMSDRTRYAPPSVEQRLAGRPSVDDLVREREGGAMLQMGLAGYEGARRAHNFVAAPVGAAIGITKEALRNPAVRARAISLFRLERLAQVNPAVWGRVASTLQRAAQRDEEGGTTHHLKAANHVLLQRDVEYRAADAAVAEELQGLDDDALARRLIAR